MMVWYVVGFEMSPKHKTEAATMDDIPHFFLDPILKNKHVPWKTKTIIHKTID